MHQSKCRKCQRDYRFKHASVLHDYYVEPNVTVSDEAVDTSCRSPSFTSTVNADPDIVVNRKFDAVDKCVILLHTCAVRVSNSDTGKTTLAYA